MVGGAGGSSLGHLFPLYRCLAFATYALDNMLESILHSLGLWQFQHTSTDHDWKEESAVSYIRGWFCWSWGGARGSVGAGLRLWSWVWVGVHVELGCGDGGWSADSRRSVVVFVDFVQSLPWCDVFFSAYYSGMPM